MIGNPFHQLFLLGANELATTGVEYGPPQAAAGFTEDEWLLLTSQDCWSLAQQRKIGNTLANAVSLTLAIAGLPVVPLPGAFVAAVICKLIAPCNRMAAALSAPESFDAMSAAGIVQESVIRITTKQQMMGLVTYFSSAEFGALSGFKIDELVNENVIELQAQESTT